MDKSVFKNIPYKISHAIPKKKKKKRIDQGKDYFGFNNILSSQYKTAIFAHNGFGVHSYFFLSNFMKYAPINFLSFQFLILTSLKFHFIVISNFLIFFRYVFIADAVLILYSIVM